MIDDAAAGKIASALIGNKITVFLDLSGNAFVALDARQRPYVTVITTIHR